MKVLRIGLLLVLTLSLVACDDGEGEGEEDLIETTDQLELDEVEEVDPCEDKTLCEEATYCDGTVLVHCEEDEDGCLVESVSADCAELEYGVCDSVTKQCASRHPCEGISNCDEVGTSCDGDVVVVCEATSQGCLVESRRDCSDSGAQCIETESGVGCGFDPCSEVENPCALVGRTCEEGTLEVCEINIYGCREKKTYDCEGLGGTCENRNGVNSCVVAGSCGDEDRCNVELRECDGTDLYQCGYNEYGCLVEKTAKCAQTQIGYGFCQAAQPASCAVTFNEACDGVETCSQVGSRCEGEILYTCDLNALSCLEESTYDCTSDDQICHVDEEGAASCVNPCDLFFQCPEEVYCEDNAIITCSTDEYGCLVESDRQSCTITNQVCEINDGVAECVTPPVIDLTSTPGTTIADNSTITDMIDVPTLCRVGSIQVMVDITHSYVGDLLLHLQAPSGLSIVLMEPSGSDDDLVGTFPTTLTPEESLDAFVGAQAQGGWTLSVTDEASSDTGSLNTWGLHIECE